MLVQGLPENAALWREDSWTRQDEMLASLLELTDAWGHAMIAVHGGKMKGNPKPLHVKRPWEPEPTDTQGLQALRAEGNDAVLHREMELRR